MLERCGARNLGVRSHPSLELLHDGKNIVHDAVHEAVHLRVGGSFDSKCGAIPRRSVRFQVRRNSGSHVCDFSFAIGASKHNNCFAATISWLQKCPNSPETVSEAVPR